MTANDDTPQPPRPDRRYVDVQSIHFQVSRPMHDAIVQAADAEGRTISSLLRQIVKQYLKRT